MSGATAQALGSSRDDTKAVLVATLAQGLKTSVPCEFEGAFVAAFEERSGTLDGVVGHGVNPLGGAEWMRQPSAGGRWESRTATACCGQRRPSDACG